MRNATLAEDDSRMQAGREARAAPDRRNLDFFRGILQATVPVGKYMMCMPLFYYDFTALLVTFVTPLERIRPLLPSPVMHALRLTPWHGVTVFAAFEYRDTDIGPYNELSIAFPITLHKPAPVLTGLLKPMSEGMTTYIRHLPVTTEIARDLGIEHAGYPKFLADIRFDRHEDWIDCRVAEGGSHILTLSARKGSLQAADRMRFHAVNVHYDRILYGMATANVQRVSLSRNPSDVRLELGNHSIAQELGRLGLGRMIDCRYCPEGQLILNSVLESYELTRP
ncbi:MAG: acetoacetate decarboxylase family protein [Rudaea sp.]